MSAIVVGLCSFPVFSFGFSLPGFSFTIPSLPTFSISLDLTCPLN
jgi:hypothetical protein